MALIDKLVDGVQAEAQKSIDTAIDANGDAAIIAEAQASMGKAQIELDQGKLDKAISSYRNAWDKGQKAAKSGGGGSADFGSLTITGADTGDIGDSFTPASTQSTGSLSWDRNSDEAAVSLVVSGALDLDPATGSVVFSFVRLNPSAGFGYIIPCRVSPAECAKISANDSTKTISFDNVILTNTPGNSATAPIVFNGSLNWQ